MNPNETSVNGEQVEHPGTPSFDNSTELSILNFSDAIPNRVEFEELINSLFNPDVLQSDSTLCNGENRLVQSPPASSPEDDSNPWKDICTGMVGTERDHRSSPPTVSPVSTYSGPTMHPTPEDTEALNTVKGAIDNSSGNPKDSALPAALSKPGCSRTCTGCHDAHGLTTSEVENRRNKFFQGVLKKKKPGRFGCETRVSKKLLVNSEPEAKTKLWLGTFDTQCQAARALHVGRFLLSEKKKSTTVADFEQDSSETIRALLKFKDSTRGKPFDAELLRKVKKLAAKYGKNGSL